MARQRDAFVERLRGSGYAVAVNGPTGDRRHPGNANLRFDGFAQEILGALQPHLAASTGSACTSGIPEPSHVLRAIGLSREEAERSIRFSFGRFTTDRTSAHHVSQTFDIGFDTAHIITRASQGQTKHSRRISFSSLPSKPASSDPGIPHQDLPQPHKTCTSRLPSDCRAQLSFV